MKVLYEVTMLETGTPDIIEISRKGDRWIMTGYEPPRVIQTGKTFDDCEKILRWNIDNNVYGLIRTHL